MKKPKVRTEKASFTFAHKRARISIVVAATGTSGQIDYGPFGPRELMRTIFTTLAQGAGGG